MEFWRREAYDAYFNYLDRAGGFFYERWGDAPVHSIGLGLFEDASKIHWWVEAFNLCVFLANGIQVPRYWLSAYSILQLPQLAKMQWLPDGQIYRRRSVVEQRRLQASLVQTRWNGLKSD
jgi:hypothetical protein